MVIKLPYSDCGCGKTFDLYKDCIVGRYDDMVKIRGVWFVPSMIEDVVRKFKEIDEYQCILSRYKEMDKLTIKIELKSTVPPTLYSKLAQDLAQEIKRELGFSVEVEVVKQGSLPRFELKAKRFQDVR